MVADVMMKIQNNQAYRETYQKWMDKQAEINKKETELQQLEREATELKQRLNDYKQQKI